MKITDKINITNEDCMELLKRTPDKFYELAIVDPPYGIGENGDKNHSRGKITKSKNYKSFAGGDVSAPDIDYFIELKRVSKNQIIWGANHFIENIPNSNSSCWIVWDKDNGLTDFADSELAYTSFKSAVRNFKFKWQGMLQGNMKNKEIRIHPTQKPVALLEYLIKTYTLENETVLDFTMGSGSTGIACVNTNRNFIGIEMDDKYFDIASNRINTHMAQVQMF